MVISLNPNPTIDEFRLLLENTIKVLEEQSKNNQKEFVESSGIRLEVLVKNAMEERAKGTPFEDSIRLISGQKFPDIIANNYFGVEVKSTKQNHWTTTGNSVLEGTRVEGIEKIFIIFGKMNLPIEFKCRPYEDCLSDVVVTHSPRYLIDMNLKQGDTIFDKINYNYDVLRNSKNPIDPIIKYYKSRLKPGEQVWWIDPEENQGTKLVIKIWNSLPNNEKKSILCKSMIFFPEIFSNRNDKYSKLAFWLLTREAIICPNLRDLFTAKGRKDLSIKGRDYYNVPRVFVNLMEFLNEITLTLNQTSPKILTEFWQIETSEEKKLSDWIALVFKESKLARDAKHLDIQLMINEKLSEL